MLLQIFEKNWLSTLKFLCFSTQFLSKFKTLHLQFQIRNKDPEFICDLSIMLKLTNFSQFVSIYLIALGTYQEKWFALSLSSTQYDLVTFLETFLTTISTPFLIFLIILRWRWRCCQYFIPSMLETAIKAGVNSNFAKVSKWPMG